MMAINDASFEDVLAYDAETGKLTWKVARGRVKAGQRAGTRCNEYRVVRVFGEQIYEHRLIWRLVHGDWPEADVDHINGDKSDNRLENLRAASRAQNHANRKLSRNNKSGFKGVFWNSQRRMWQAAVTIRRKQVHLGFFNCPTLAFLAYSAGAKKYFGDFARPSSRGAA